MFFRVFSFLWGTILLTSVVFAAIVGLMDLAPPRDAQVSLELKVLEWQLQAHADTGGIAAAEAAWRIVAPVHPEVQVLPDPMCAGARLITDDAGRCLAVGSPLLSGFGLHRITPFLPPLLLGAVISALMAALLSRHLVAPLRRLGQAMGALAGGALHTRVSADFAGTGPEMERLGTAFDTAAAQLQELAGNRRQLLHDLSHELRSPLARLGAAIGLIDKSPERHAALMEQISTDIARMDQMLGELLTLSLLTSPEAEITRVPLDLMDILEPILSDASFEAEPRKITVRYSGADSLPLMGDAELLHRAIENTLRNAIRYSPPQSRIDVAGTLDNDTITVTIKDRGPGVAEAELPEMFQPFRRFASSEGTKGTGLGLAITARAISSHNGTIRASLRDGGGLAMTMTLPRDA